jgi:hypothetical protein
MHLSDRFFCVPVYGVPLNRESKDFLFFVFQSVSRANTVNMNAPFLKLRDMSLTVINAYN